MGCVSTGLHTADVQDTTRRAEVIIPFLKARDETSFRSTAHTLSQDRASLAAAVEANSSAHLHRGEHSSTLLPSYVDISTSHGSFPAVTDGTAQGSLPACPARAMRKTARTKRTGEDGGAQEKRVERGSARARRAVPNMRLVALELSANSQTVKKSANSVAELSVIKTPYQSSCTGS
eukprot:3937781-Rhodomonas_salina.3